MFYKVWRLKVATLLVVTTLLLSEFSHVFAQYQAADAQGEPAQTQTIADSSCGTVRIKSMEIVSIRAFQEQFNVLVRGELSDTCIQINEIQQRLVGNQILLTIILHPLVPDLMCAAVLVPFTKTVTLNVLGFAAGDYTVVLRNVKAKFTLAADNLPTAQIYMQLVSR